MRADPRSRGNHGFSGLRQLQTAATIRYQSFVHRTPAVTRVVIVSRDPQRSLQWRRELAVASHDVVAITNAARSARALLQRHEPRVVLCELRLLDGTATAMIQWLACEPDAQRPAIVVVAHDVHDPLLREAMRSGADNYFLDGGDGESLVAAVRQALQGESALAPALARALLDHFDRTAPLAHERPSVDAVQSPLQLEPDERELLLRVATDIELPDLAEQRGVRPQALGALARSVWRKLQWDRRAGSLTLQLA